MLKKISLLLFVTGILFACSDDDDMIAACNEVANVSSSLVTDTSINLTWNDASNVGSYTVEYGVTGFPLGGGTTISTTDTSISISGLLGNTTYDVYVQTICSENNMSMLTEVYSFTTSVTPCIAVTNVSSSMITDTSALVAWEDNANSSTTYELEYGNSGFNIGSGTTITSNTTSLELTGLLPNTDYDVYVRAVCSASNVSPDADVISFTTLAIPVIPEFRPTLSELNLFTGDLNNLEITPYGFEYDLHSTLYTDYAIKQRFFVLPTGEKLTYTGEGLPVFPNNSIIVKTFYYNVNETDLSQGTQIIETRILIKIDGSWESGNYKWNDAQTEATLDANSSIVPVTWTNAEGESNSINYEIPSNTDCFTCHQNTGNMTPIGPKMRTINFDFNGANQIQQLIDNDMLDGLTDPTSVSLLPKWDDPTVSLDRRARAYMDINCAHCHTPGGFCEEESTLRLSYETPYVESSISERRNSILTRIQNTIPQYGMPLIGRTVVHDEGVDLLIDYINSLE
ncbi:fibronectin type III domain-containing protein [Psychroserpens damuponensis]|uniref:fibronectin type III domain-containing protein n=1 Tax=Psychroserpens damuponensis TaxID=943936 RepID=UPI0009FE2558|nr:fibronectin type III domain-containing protein [Psychroserpens damuponensis]